MSTCSSLPKDSRQLEISWSLYALVRPACTSSAVGRYTHRDILYSPPHQAADASSIFMPVSGDIF